MKTFDIVSFLDQVKLKDVRLTHRPVSYSQKHYSQSIEKVVGFLSRFDEIAAVYQIGSVGDTGISDIDLMAVFHDEVNSFPFSYRNVFNKQDSYLFMHGIYGIPVSVFKKRDFLISMNNCQKLAGQEIQLRFHVITGFTTNRDGIQLDDISIPELGYFDGAEDNNGGWEAKGFVRSSNLVPAEWIIWLVKASNPLQVERITLNPEQSAKFTIEELGDTYSLAAVVVSPTAPVTTIDLDYEIMFNQP